MEKLSLNDSLVNNKFDKHSKYGILFIWDYSWRIVLFLDVQVLSENNEILTNLYIKETDTHQYHCVIHTIAPSKFT